MAVTRTHVFTSGGPTYVSEDCDDCDLAAVRSAIDAGQATIQFHDISGTTFTINVASIVSVMDREDPQ